MRRPVPLSLESSHSVAYGAGRKQGELEQVELVVRKPTGAVQENRKVSKPKEALDERDPGTGVTGLRVDLIFVYVGLSAPFNLRCWVWVWQKKTTLRGVPFPVGKRGGHQEHAVFGL